MLSIAGVCFSDTSPLCKDGRSYIDENTQRCFKAISCLEKAVELAQYIENEEIKVAVSSELDSCEKCLKRKFLYKDYKAVSNACMGLYENIDGLLAECTDHDLCANISSCICEMAKEVESFE